MHILWVSSPDHSSESLRDRLSAENMVIDLTMLDRGVEVAHRRSHDVVVVDVTDEQSAHTFVRDIRVDGWNEPMMLVTPDQNTERDVRLLENGADDCIAHPVEVPELIARMRTLIRRCAPGQGTAVGFEDLTLNTQTRGVMRQGQSIPLTAREFAVLEYFVHNPRRIITRQELGQHVWDGQYDADSNVIDVFISRLRRKIDKPFDAPLLHTLIGSGYMLSATPPYGA